MHVIVVDEVKGQARSCPGRQYPSTPCPDYPLGIQYRFVPNTADPDFSVPPRTRIIADKLRCKQASFLDNLIERKSLHFNNLHSALLNSNPNVVLSKVLMSMKSKRFPSRHLFISVEQAYDGAPACFQYTTELGTEADALIPVLLLALQGIYGQEADKWFKFSARIGIEGFSFDKVNNRIVPTGNNTFDDLDQTWDQHAEGFREEDLWMEGDDGADDEFGGLAIDLGVINLEARDDRAFILNDDSASVGTTNAPPPPGFREDNSFSMSSQEDCKDMMDDDSDIAVQEDERPLSDSLTPNPFVPTDQSDLIQRFLNDPTLLCQLHLTQQAQAAQTPGVDPSASPAASITALVTTPLPAQPKSYSSVTTGSTADESPGAN
jgi:hypothetical protein